MIKKIKNTLDVRTLAINSGQKLKLPKKWLTLGVKVVEIGSLYA